MKIVAPRQSVKRLLRWSQAGLFAVAAVMLGCCAFVVADSWIYQRQESRLLDAPHPRLAAPLRPTALMKGEMMGRIEIPRLGLSVIVAEGTDEGTLRRAAGHIEGTQLPGTSGNVGIAGHRDTLFRSLQNIRQEDVITLTTLQGLYRYRVVSTKIVDPDDVGVLHADGQEILTLVTCYPFYFVGPAPDRFIVRAARML
jgi:sortase A